MNRQLTMLIVDDMEVERISFAEIFKDEYQTGGETETGDGTTGTTKGTYCSS